MQINYPDMPKGKRAVQINIWGNMINPYTIVFLCILFVALLDVPR